MHKRTSEEQIQARLRELTDELRQRRREFQAEHERAPSGYQGLLRKPPPRGAPSRPKR